MKTIQIGQSKNGNVDFILSEFNKKPPFIIRFGSFIMLVLVIILFIISLFIKGSSKIPVVVSLIRTGDKEIRILNQAKIVGIMRKSGSIVRVGDTLYTIRTISNNDSVIIANANGILRTNNRVRINSYIMKNEIIAFIQVGDGDFTIDASVKELDSYRIKVGQIIKMRLPNHNKKNYEPINALITEIPPGQGFSDRQKINAVIYEDSNKLLLRSYPYFTNITPDCTIEVDKKSILSKIFLK